MRQIWNRRLLAARASKAGTLRHAPALQTFVNIDVIFLSLACVAMGLIGGAPYDHPDQLVIRALRALQAGLDYRFFNYPGLLIDLNMLLYGAAFVIMDLGGVVSGPIEFAQRYRDNILFSAPVEVPFIFPSHVITILFSVLGVVCTYALTYQLLKQRFFALVAGCLVAGSLLWTVNAHYSTVDVPLAALTAATILLTLYSTRHARPLSMKQVVLLGTLLGLTASAKYNGAIVVIPIVVAMFFCYSNRKQWIAHCLMLGIASLVVFLVTNPFILINFQEFMADFSFELAHSKNGHPGSTTDQAWLFHLRTSLSYGMGWLSLVIAAVGLGWMLSTTELRVSTKLTVSLFPLLHYLVMSNSTLAFQRYMLPMVPFVAVYASCGLYALYRLLQTVRFVRRWKLAQLVVVGIAAAIIVPNLLLDVKHNALLARADTRLVLARIVEQTQLSSAPNRLVLSDFIEPAFRTQEEIVLGRPNDRAVDILTYDIFDDHAQTGERLDQADPQSWDILIFDSFGHDGLIYDPRIRRQFAADLLDNRSLIQISPFDVAKDHIPYSPESLYSPYLPDLAYRNRPGPFIELYVRDAATAQQIYSACAATETCTLLSSDQGFYYRNLVMK